MNAITPFHQSLPLRPRADAAEMVRGAGEAAPRFRRMAGPARAADQHAAFTYAANAQMKAPAQPRHIDTYA